MDASSIVAIILASSTAVTGLIVSFFHSASLSRCRNVSMCWGLCDCDREVLSEDTYRAEQVDVREEQN